MINIWDACQKTQHWAFERFRGTMLHYKLIQSSVADDLINVYRAMGIVENYKVQKCQYQIL